MKHPPTLAPLAAPGERVSRSGRPFPTEMRAASNPGAKLVPPVHAFDATALGAYIHRHVDPFGGELEVEQFQGGQSNPTYRVTAGDRRYILRRKPPGNLLPSAHAVDREYRVMSALAATDVPVARMLALCEDASVIGTAFYLMEYVEGRVLWDPRLPGMEPTARAAHHDEMNRVLRLCTASTTPPSASRTMVASATTLNGRSRAGRSSTNRQMSNGYRRWIG